MRKRGLCTAAPPLKEGGGAVVHRLEETRGGKIIKVKGTKSVLKKVRAVGYCGLFSCPCIHPGHPGHCGDCGDCGHCCRWGHLPFSHRP